MYYLVVLEGGAKVTIFHDLLTENWFYQQTAKPTDEP